MPVTRLGAVTGESYYRALGFEGFDGPRGAALGPKGYITLPAARANVALPTLSDIADAKPFSAHLNADRWLVACPDCLRNFQIAWATVGLYMCIACWNRAVGGQWRRYVLPKERDAIEIAVTDVPAAQRNWLPGWSVARTLLQAGNAAPLSAIEYASTLKSEA